MRLIFCLAALLTTQVVADVALGETLPPYEQVIRADFANDGGASSAWLFSDQTLHCAHSVGCRKVIDAIRVPRGSYACRVTLIGGFPAYRLYSPMRVIVNVARGRGGFDYYADPYGATGPTRLEALLYLRPKGSDPAGCMKAAPVFDCQHYGCRAAQPGGIAW